jgi:hypothetical protein
MIPAQEVMRGGIAARILAHAAIMTGHAIHTSTGKGLGAARKHLLLRRQTVLRVSAIKSSPVRQLTDLHLSQLLILLALTPTPAQPDTAASDRESLHPLDGPLCIDLSEKADKATAFARWNLDVGDGAKG